MPESAVKTQEQVAIAAARQLFTQEVYQPDLLRVYIAALKQALNRLSLTGEEIPDAFITKNGLINRNEIIAALTRFNQTLEKNLSIEKLNLFDPTHLDRLDKIIIQVSGPAASAEAAQPPLANIPPDLKALVAEFDKAHQAAVSAQAKRRGWSPEKFREQIALQNQITVQMHQVRQYTLSQLEWAITNSTALENLAASLGVRPQDVKDLALKRAETSVDKNITALTFRQARSLITDPVQLAVYYTARLKADVMADDMLILAAVDKDPKTKQKYLDTALKKTKETVTQETAKAKPAIETAAKNLQEHPTVAAVARRTAQEAVKQVKPDIPPAKAARLNQQLVRHLNNPSIQEKLVVKALGIPPSQAKVVLNSLRPSLSQLAASTKKLNPLLAADPDGIAADALRHPHLFPKPFVDAIKSGKITDAQVAEIFQISRLLGVPTNAVILSRFGVNAQNLAANLQAGKKWLGIIPMGHGLDPQDASVVKLSHLAAAQQQLIKSLESPPPLLPEHIPNQFLSASRAAARANRLNEFFDQINPFRLPSALSYNFSRIPPLGSLGNAGGSFISGLRVQSAPINSFFNFISSAGNTIRQAPSFLTAPFRAVGSAISNTIINPVKTWANTQIKSGLARAGAWLAKKGVTEAAKKIGMALLGKGTAALLAQAVPVAGQIAGALMLLSTLGDIGKFLWQNRKTVGLTLGGLFFLGQMLLGKLFAALSGLTNILGFAGLGAGIGFMVGGPVGALIGAGIGGLVGWGISAAGGLGAALSGLGTALGSAAAGLSSFIGALTAPSLVAGVGGTLAAVGLGGLGLTAALVIFFIQPTINSALFVPAGEETIVGERRPAENWGCPLDSPRITTTSYDAASQTGHGSNQYWEAVTVCSHAGLPVGCSQEEEKIAWCRYSLPQSIGCIAPDSNGAGSECSLNFDQYAQQFESKKGYSASRCSSYGFAIDIISQTGSVEVFMPGIDGEETTWTYSQSFENPGAGWSHIYNSGIYTLILTHLEKDVVTAEVPAGTPIGNLFDMDTNTHLHLEFAIDGVYQRPEDYFCGGG